MKHAFIEPLPRRQASAGHPLGQACQSCWHLPSQDEGPQTGRHFRLTVRKAALTLVRVGEGLTVQQSQGARGRLAVGGSTARPRRQRPRAVGDELPRRLW